MPNSTRIACPIAVALIAHVLIADAASAGQQVRAQFTDGTVVVAELDKRTNNDRLVLRFTGETSILLRSVVWNRVVALVPVNGSTAFVPPSGSNATRPSNTAQRYTFAQRATEALTGVALRGVALEGLSSSNQDDAEKLGFIDRAGQGCTDSATKPATTMAAAISQPQPMF